MRMLDLFSGIGGFALAAESVWDNLEIVGFCEIEEFATKVLKKNFPNVPIYDDVRTLNTETIEGQIDLLVGGFPCQDISQAGKGVGIEGERSGLWSEMFRIISDLRPKFVIAENVSAITFRGLDRVLSDLAQIGYNAEWQCISASSVGAWHKRERIWIIAYPNSNSFGHLHSKPEEFATERGKPTFSNSTSICKTLPNSSGIRPQTEKENKELGRTRPTKSSSRDRIQIREGSISQSRLGRMADGLSYWMDEPKGIPRVGKDVIDRKGRIKGCGNAIVPQVIYQVMLNIKRILDDSKDNAFNSRGRKSSISRSYPTA